MSYAQSRQWYAGHGREPIVYAAYRMLSYIHLSVVACTVACLVANTMHTKYSHKSDPVLDFVWGDSPERMHIFPSI